eukprot:gene7066-5528_t
MRTYGMLNQDTMDSRLEFCKVFDRYGKTEDRRVFNNCIWMGKTWFKDYPVTNFL